MEGSVLVLPVEVLRLGDLELAVELVVVEQVRLLDAYLAGLRVQLYDDVL